MPSRRLRRLIGVGVAVYLVWQIAVPLRYYLRDDRRDERFAWRIFSVLAIAPYRCEVHVQELAHGARFGPEVNLGHTLHDAWIVMLRQGQDAVVSRVLRTRCLESGPQVDAVEYSRLCRRPDGGPAPRMRVRRDCRSGEVSVVEDTL